MVVIVVVYGDGDGVVEVDATVDGQIILVNIATTPSRSNATVITFLADELAELHHIERSSALHRFTTSDLVAIRAVGFGPATGPFGDVSDDGLRGSGQLICSIGMTAV